MVKKKSIISILVTYLFVFLPALRPYAVTSGLSLDLICIILCLLLGSINILNKKTICKKTLYYYFSMLISTTICYILYRGSSWYTSSLYINNILSHSICFFCIIFLSKKIDPRLFVKILYRFAVLVSIIVLYQRICLTLFGEFNQNFYLPWFELNRDIDVLTKTRPSACFMEPAHISIFLLPIFYLALHQRKLLLVGLFILTILATGSTTGFVMLLPVLLLALWEMNIKRGFVILSVIFCIILFIGIFLFVPTIFESNITKLSETDANENIRLLGPILYFDTFNVLNHLFGIGINQMEEYGLANSLPLNVCVNYANAILFSYISFGLIGCFLLLLYLKKILFYCTHQKGFWFILVFILCSDQILYNSNLAYLLVFIINSDVLMDKYMHQKLSVR